MTAFSLARFIINSIATFPLIWSHFHTGGATIWVFAFKSTSWFLRGKQSGSWSFFLFIPSNLSLDPGQWHTGASEEMAFSGGLTGLTLHFSFSVAETKNLPESESFLCADFLLISLKSDLVMSSGWNCGSLLFWQQLLCIYVEALLYLCNWRNKYEEKLTCESKT